MAHALWYTYIIHPLFKRTPCTLPLDPPPAKKFWGKPKSGASTGRKKWQVTKYIRYTWKQIRIREKGDYSSWEQRGTQNIYELKPKWAGHPCIVNQHDIKNDNKTPVKFLAVFKLYQNLGRMFHILEFFLPFYTQFRLR